MFNFFRRHSHYPAVHKKWKARHHAIQDSLWTKHKGALDWFLNKPKQLAIGSLVGAIMLASPGVHLVSASQDTVNDRPFQDIDNNTFFLNDLSNMLPAEVRPLSQNEEERIAQVLTKHVGFTVTPQLQGIRLNRSYGIIGQEQHLKRYPHDTVENQLSTANDSELFSAFGMAPGLGAYGYFAKHDQMTQEESDREKWYIAVQTFLAPGFAEHTKEYNDFFAFRKMLVVNPQNGKAVVADIGDAGPSPWTGKQLGGSPEVMHYLERVDGKDRGPVLYFFIDDPDNKIPLGPVEVQ